MARFICPGCGSKYFLVSRTGPKKIFHVVEERAVQFVQLDTGIVDDIDTHDICCGACSWHGSLDELVESHRD